MKTLNRVCLALALGLAGTLSLQAQSSDDIIIVNYGTDPSFSFGSQTNPNSPSGNPGLGEAAHFGVLALTGSIDHSGPTGPDANPYSVGGDAGVVTSGEKFQASGSVRYGGNVFLHNGVTYNSSAPGVPQPTMGAGVDSMLAQAKQDALNASAAATALGATPDASYGTINSSTTISEAFAGNYVFNITGINFSGNKVLTLSAPAGSSFLLNVTSQIVLTGGSIRVAGGLTAANVMINYTGSTDIRFSGGGNTSRVDATILAPNATVKISPGFVGGSVIAGDIQMSSGADVVPEASATRLMLFGLLIGAATFTRFRRTSSIRN